MLARLRTLDRTDHSRIGPTPGKGSSKTFINRPQVHAKNPPHRLAIRTGSCTQPKTILVDALEYPQSSPLLKRPDRI